MDPEAIKALVFVCVPFPMLYEKYLPLVLEHRLNPEVGLDDGASYQFRWGSFQRVARILKSEGLKVTIHAPFLEVLPAASDPRIRKVSLDRLTWALKVAELFEARSVVCHSGFVPQWYRGEEERWLLTAMESFAYLAEKAEAVGIPLMLENVFEPTPELYRRIFEAVSSPYFRFCLDAGHQKAFAGGDLKDWLKVLGPYIGQLHLHDNTGHWDDHLPVGAGSVDFEAIFEYLYQRGTRPIITLEPHREEDVYPSLEGLGRLFKKYPLF